MIMSRRPEICITPEAAVCDGPHRQPFPINNGRHALLVGDEHGFRLYHDSAEKHDLEPEGMATWVRVYHWQPK